MVAAIIADDEAELRTYLRNMLGEVWPQLEIYGEAANGQEVLELIDCHSPQVVFLDIKMPGPSGLKIAEKIGDRCHIVFVTAYNQYAVEAFEREAVDYLVKPVTEKRLALTVQRIKKLQTIPEPHSGLTDAVKQILANIQNTARTDYLQWIKVQHKDSVQLIPIDDVDYFQADGKYTLVMTASDESVIRTSIKELTRELDPQKFWQIHRATIVNVSKIEGVSRSVTGRGDLKMRNRKELLTVSRQYLYLFKQM
jgi:DNA-binding LytR/AlgR family response regulator